MRNLFLICILSMFSTAYAAGPNDQPGVPPPGFDLFLKNNKNKSFKLKVPIHAGKKTEMQEIKAGTQGSVKKLKAAMYKMKKACNLRSAPDQSSKVFKVVGKNRKVWVEHHNIYWGKVYRKTGTAYINRSCL